MALRTVTTRIYGPGGAHYSTHVVNSVDIQSDETTEEGIMRLIIEGMEIELIEMTGPKGIEEFPLTVEEDEGFRKE